MTRSSCGRMRALALVPILIFMLQVVRPVPVLAAGLSVTKQVAVNGLSPAASATASPGDTLMYILYVYNNTGAAVTGVTLSDPLQPGQTLLTAQGGTCSYASTTRTLSCQLADIGNGGKEPLVIYTTVDSGFSGNISNVAQASAANTPAVFSNPTLVSVAGGQVVPNGILTICGTVTSATASQVQIAGQTLPFAPGVYAAGSAFTTGSQYCIAFTLNSSGQVVSFVAGNNLPGVSYACGVYVSSAGSNLNLSGLTFPVAANTVLPAQLAAGQPYCFLLGPDDAIVGMLTGVPIAATPLFIDRSSRHGHIWLR